MVDQNNIGTQINWQVVMGSNPYDLVDNKNIQSPQNISLQKNPLVEEKWPGNFMKWLIRFVAKISGQPDPETGKINVNTNVKKNINQELPVDISKAVQKSKNAFDSIMGGITWFLDKVEEKVESVSWVDLDSFGNMPQKKEALKQDFQSVQQVQSQQIPVQQNIPLQSAPIQQVTQDIPNVGVQELEIENNVFQNPVKNLSQENTFGSIEPK